MTPEQDSGSLSVAQRINIAGEKFGANRREVMEELRKIAEDGDAAGLKKLIDACVGWELKGYTDNETEEETRQRVLSGIDSDASLADEIKNTDSEFVAMTNITEGINTIGMVTKFFRATTNYHPAGPQA